MKTQTFFRPGVLVTLMLASCASTNSAPPPPVDTYPQRELRNRKIQMRVYLPDAADGFYRGPRFDWSGIISHVSYKGHTFFGPFKSTHDPLNHDDILGPAEEFGMDSPLGYDEASPGQSFLKIGVGELRRPADSKYAFFEQYDVVKPLTWTVQGDGGTLTFAASQRPMNGYAYDYSKQIRLGADGFIITHHLRNTGEKLIETDHYCHNFIIIDDTPVGPGYTVTYPAPVSTSTPARNVSPAVLTGNEISFAKELVADKAVWMKLDGWSNAADATATVRLDSANAAIRISGHVAPSKLVLYAMPRAVCPETFIPIRLNPGEEFTWATEYQFLVDAPVNSKR